MNSLQIFDYFLSLTKANGIKVMIDIHSAETNASGHTANLWYTSKVSTEQYLAALAWAANRYKDNNTAPLLIGEWGGFMREPNLT